MKFLFLSIVMLGSFYTHADLIELNDLDRDSHALSFNEVTSEGGCDITVYESNVSGHHQIALGEHYNNLYLDEWTYYLGGESVLLFRFHNPSLAGYFVRVETQGIRSNATVEDLARACSNVSIDLDENYNPGLAEEEFIGDDERSPDPGFFDQIRFEYNRHHIRNVFRI